LAKSPCFSSTRNVEHPFLAKDIAELLAKETGWWDVFGFWSVEFVGKRPVTAGIRR
jgi:hypothetical protein